jgi:hypothetical protein
VNHLMGLNIKNINYNCLKLKVLRKIFGPKKDDTSEQFRMFHNEDVHGLYRPQALYYW